MSRDFSRTGGAGLASTGKVPLAVVLVSLIVGWTAFPIQEQDREVPGLEAIFEDGPILQDRNGDGHIDFVDAHLILGEPPSDADVAAAANVAARLGFETSAMNLPLTKGGNGVPIVMGLAGLRRMQISRGSIGADLEPGIGVVAWVDTDSNPALVVVGGDSRR